MKEKRRVKTDEKQKNEKDKKNERNVYLEGINRPSLMTRFLEDGGWKS